MGQFPCQACMHFSADKQRLLLTSLTDITLTMTKHGLGVFEKFTLPTRHKRHLYQLNKWAIAPNSSLVTEKSQTKPQYWQIFYTENVWSYFILVNLHQAWAKNLTTQCLHKHFYQIRWKISTNFSVCLLFEWKLAQKKQLQQQIVCIIRTHYISI